MKRIKSLNKFQKVILCFMTLIVFTYTAVYYKTTSKEGMLYLNHSILVPAQKSDDIEYSGQINGKQAVFIVSKDKTVVFKYDDRSYGPYVAQEDPTAIFQDAEIVEGIKGVVLKKNDEIIFRGSYYKVNDELYLLNEDGSLNLSSSLEMMNNQKINISDEIRYDEEGNLIDPMEPSAFTILSLMQGVKLTHKGDWGMWFGALFVCILTAISILFADELFRWHLSFEIRNAKKVEASDWEMMSRYISWIILPIIAVAIFNIGLK